MASDEAEAELVTRGRELLRISRLRRMVIIGTCTAAVILFAITGSSLWGWLPLRAWMLPALLIPLLFVLLAVFSLKAPENVRKRLWVRRAVLIAWPLLVFPLLAWGASDLSGFGGGLYGGLGAGFGVALVNIIREWPRNPGATRDHEDGHQDE